MSIRSAAPPNKNMHRVMYTLQTVSGFDITALTVVGKFAPGVNRKEPFGLATDIIHRAS